MKTALVSLLFVVIVEPISRPATRAQKADPTPIASTQVFEAIRLLSSYAEVGLPEADTIVGTRTFEKSVLAANVLTFESGSRLTFGGAMGDRTERYIFVRILRIKGPGTITWDRELATRRSVAPIGEAPPGTIGGGDGQDGGRGPDGQPGNPGYPGRSAPILYLVAERIEGGPIEIDLRGQDGGAGGVGQAGGDGGIGRAGTPAFAVFSKCRSAGSNGGNGGRGGNGGPGGEGGRGGNGGTFVLLAPAQALELFEKSLFVDIRPGRGGEGADGGEPGDGGYGATAGPSEGDCPAGQGGKNGDGGNKGPKGQRGGDGQLGAFVRAALTEQQIRSLQLRPLKK